MQVPKHFWVDIVSTTCFLINYISSSVLHGETPYHDSFPNKSLFLFEPMIFGCNCFYQDVCPQVTKFDPMKCIFLGYSRVQKGYMYYCPTPNGYLVSIDVTFLENTTFSPPVS